MQNRRMQLDQRRAPIYEALENFRRMRVVPFDVPGHKRGRGNPELAQLFVEYMISDETQSKVAEAMNEAPVNKNATMPDELKTYLAFGEDAMSSLKEFDETYISQAKEEWIDTFQRTVAVQ